MKSMIIYIADFFQLCLFFVRFILHGCESFLLQKPSQTEIDILGNGPSLKQYIGHESQKCRDSLCVNFSPMTDEFYLIRPKYLVLIDQLFFDESNERVIKLRDALTNKVDWDITIVTFKSNFHKAKKLYGNDYIAFIGLPQISYNPTTDLFKTIKYKLFQLGVAMPTAQNVIIAAIFFSINKGYKTINLYGVEHSWLKDTYVTMDNVVCLKDSHYYGTENIPWSYNEDGTTWKMSQVLYALYLKFRGYDELKLYAEYIGGISIINKTKDSWIDAFYKDESV